jgi:hypothetical protein
MSSDHTTVGPGRRPLASKPERIPLNDDELVRDDIKQAERGVSKRTAQREDAEGAPYIMIGGVKYRPNREYNAFTASRIVRQGPPPAKRRRARRAA